MGLLDGKIAKTVARSIKQAKIDKAAVLIVMTPGTREVGRTAAGTNPTATSYKCRGLVPSWKRTMLNQTIVQSTDRVVALFGATISGGNVVPKITDKITIEGTTTRIVDIERDPASAVYNCLTR